MSTEAEMIDRNLHDFYQRIAESCGFETGTMGGCDYVWNRKGSWPGYMLGIPDPEKIPEIADAVRQGKMPAFWILDDSNKEVNRFLEEIGMRPVRQWKGMILHADAFRPSSPDASIEIVSNDQATLREWLQIVNTELITGAEIGEEVPEAFTSDSAFHWAVAYYEDQIASTGLVFSEGGIGGIYMVATRSEFRGRGLGTAVTSALADAAFRTGNHSVVLHATEMASGIYRRTGFREVNSYSISWYLG